MSFPLCCCASQVPDPDEGMNPLLAHRRRFQIIAHSPSGGLKPMVASTVVNSFGHQHVVLQEITSDLQSHLSLLPLEGAWLCLLVLKAECAHTLEGLALPRASHSGEIALSGSCRLRSTLATVPVLFAHDAATKSKLVEYSALVRAWVFASHLWCAVPRSARPLF